MGELEHRTDRPETVRQAVDWRAELEVDKAAAEGVERVEALQQGEAVNLAEILGPR